MRIIYYPWNHCESKKFFFSRYQITWLNNSVMIINWSKRLLPRRKRYNNFISLLFQEIHLVRGRWSRTQSLFSQKVGEMNNLRHFISLLYAILFKQQQQRLAILHLRRDTKTTTRVRFISVSKLQ